MFGHDDTQDDNNDNVVQPEATENTGDDSPSVQVDLSTDSPASNDDATNDDTQSSEPAVVSTAPVVPATDDSDDSDSSDDSQDLSDEKEEDAPTPAPKTSSSPGTSNPDALLEIKRSALQELSPLLGELTLPPEEKFRTTMMMIQAFDDQKLINQAYEAAKNIKDKKERAEALLDIVNEVNYFTQGSEPEQN